MFDGGATFVYLYNFGRLTLCLRTYNKCEENWNVQVSQETSRDTLISRKFNINS